MEADKVIKLTDHVTFLPPFEETDRPVLGAVGGLDGTLIIDAGNSPQTARMFLEQVEQYEMAEPRYLVLTHWHWDHVCGISEMNIPTFAHKMTYDEMRILNKYPWCDFGLDGRVMNGDETEFCRTHIKKAMTEEVRENLVIRLPDVTYGDEARMDFHLGNVTCILQHVGGDHSKDSTIVHVPEDRVLFIGDCLYPDLYRDDLLSYRYFYPLMERLLRYDVEWYLDAHMGDMQRDDMEKYCVRILAIARLVERHRTNPDTVIIEEAFANEKGRQPDEQDKKYIQSFIKGLSAK